jgi:hypothetical protein
MKRPAIIAIGATTFLGVIAFTSANSAYSREPDSYQATPARIIAAASPTCAPSWAVVPSPNVGMMGSALYGVDAVAPSDAWAVGSYLSEGTSKQRRSAEEQSELTLPRNRNGSTQQGGLERTLIERWDGSMWTVVPSPNAGPDSNELVMVDSISPTDAWAVGFYINEFGVSQNLTEHWDGTAWSVVPSANAGPLLDNRLTSVEAISSSDVWAAGYYYSDEGYEQTLTIHWDGSNWAVVTSPNVGEFGNVLNDLAAVSANDVWAVGAYINSGLIPRSLVLHWNGTNWSVIPSPGIGSGTNILYSIDAVATNDVWAVGVLYNTTGVARALTQHWDGVQWTPVPSPAQTSYNILYSVDALASNDVWAVGNYRDYSSYGYPEPLTQHWDGTAWRVISSRISEPYDYQTLYSVEAINSEDVWGVGIKLAFGASETFIEHYSTACVTCPLWFSDVPVGSTFYDAIQCLACQGIVGGYPASTPTPPPYPTYPGPIGTGQPNATSTATVYVSPTPILPTPTSIGPTFRPNANVTRGQFAKIVSNSAAYSEDPGSPMFEDVPYYDTFYQWVNRLARRGIIVGYPCGTIPSEPCRAPDNLPYFRPNADATRGQIAKMVSNSAGYTENHTEQTFEDVPTTYEFYIWIARLNSRGIVGGYPCGAPQEPCRPGNRPYFRPSANATRGQVSKMVAKAFFPNCYVP